MEKFMHNEIKREYVLYKPNNLKVGAPLVVFLHWYTGSVHDVIGATKFNEVADKYGFAVVYPQGLLDKDGNKHWNSGLEISAYDDEGFIEELTNHLIKTHKLSKENTFVTGISNGGFMSYTLAVNKPYLFSAYAPIIATMSRKNWENRTFKNPVPILHICGLNDEAVPPYRTKEPDSDGWEGSPNVDVITKYWADLAKTKKFTTEQYSKDTTIEYHTEGIDGIEVWIVKIDNHGHYYPSKNDDIDGGELLWKFFKKYLK